MASSADRPIRGAQCANTSFRRADLTGSHWHGGAFTGCDFTDAIVTDAEFTGARVRDSTGVPARGGLPGASVELEKAIPVQRQASRLRPPGVRERSQREHQSHDGIE